MSSDTERSYASPVALESLKQRKHHMSSMTLADIAKKMAGIDIAILSTHTETGAIANRPMSNNGDVEYNGSSYYFTFEQARTVAEIGRNSKVALGFTSGGGIFSKGVYIAVEGQAELIRDKNTFKAHWTPSLDRWFKDGAGTPGIVLIHVTAKRLTCWEGEDEQTIEL